MKQGAFQRAFVSAISIGLSTFLLPIPAASADSPDQVLTFYLDPGTPIPETQWNQWSQSKWIFLTQLKLDDRSRQFNPDDVSDDEENNALTWFTSADGNFAGPSKGAIKSCLVPRAMTDSGSVSTEQVSSDCMTAVVNGNLQIYTPNREFWEKGTRVAVGYVKPMPASGKCDAKVGINISDQSRESAAYEGVMALVGQSAKPTQPGRGGNLAIQEAPEPLQVPLCLYTKTQLINNDRATLTIKVSDNGSRAETGHNGGAQSQVQDANPSANDESQSQTATILTGSEEHIFFTTDVAVKHASELKYDSTGKTVTEKSAPNNPMVGINLLWGDPYKTYGWDQHRLALKLFAEPTTPWKNFGLGFGYILKDGIFDTSKDKVGAFMIFIGYQRTVGSTGLHTGSWIWGLSYNLNSLTSGK